MLGSKGLCEEEKGSGSSGGSSGGGGITMMVGVGGGENPMSGDALNVVVSGGGGDGALKVLEVRGGGKMRKLKGVNIVKEIAPTMWSGSSSGLGGGGGGGGDCKVLSKRVLPRLPPPVSPSSIAYGLISVPQVDGVLVAWGDGRVQLLRNLTKSCNSIVGEQRFHGIQFDSTDALPHCPNYMLAAPEGSGTIVENLETRSAGIKNAIRNFGVYETSRNHVLGITCTGDDGIALGYEINY
ncbi:UNVERIFIED_CONTAM: hypothetical protein HDU68_007181 [Siphonaria sp. JEL0065]|nr:hypothetical protein HDU68_007181 [Siphonaria sp. JEL0065]